MGFWSAHDEAKFKTCVAADATGEMADSGQPSVSGPDGVAGLAKGFWTGFPPALAAGVALLGWAGIYATKGRRLSQAAFGIGVLGVLFNIGSYADVFI